MIDFAPGGPQVGRTAGSGLSVPIARNVYEAPERYDRAD
jgi:hypothetical protein